MIKPEQNAHREITPLTTGDCLLVFDRKKTKFDFPIHFHPEFELNYIDNAPLAKRIVGSHSASTNELDLVLTGPNLPHGWQQGQCNSQSIHEITIQFHRDLLHEGLLQRNVMQPIHELLEKSFGGIAFSTETIRKVQPRIENLSQQNGLSSLLELISLLHELSSAENYIVLSNSIIQQDDFYNSEKIKQVLNFVQQNYMRKIKVTEVADLVNMTEVSFGRFMKQRTGKSFVDFLNDTRIGFATRHLTEKNYSISEISFLCGFNNQANFNRIFKKFKSETPKEYRENFAGIRLVN